MNLNQYHQLNLLDQEYSSSLRDELESLRFEKDAAVQQAVQRSIDEIAQLKDTAAQLRDEMESTRFEYEEKFQQQALEKVEEHRHLQETIEQLRDELESKHG